MVLGSALAKMHLFYCTNMSNIYEISYNTFGESTIYLDDHIKLNFIKFKINFIINVTDESGRINLNDWHCIFSSNLNVLITFIHEKVIFKKTRGLDKIK